jgi:hypothetical protein
MSTIKSDSKWFDWPSKYEQPLISEGKAAVNMPAKGQVELLSPAQTAAVDKSFKGQGLRYGTCNQGNRNTAILKSTSQADIFEAVKLGGWQGLKNIDPAVKYVYVLPSNEAAKNDPGLPVQGAFFELV